MKKLTVTALFVLAAVLAGCVVTSVQPFYTQKDLLFEPGIIGIWVNEKNTNELWKFEQQGDLAYRFALMESDKTTVMQAHAFKLGGQLFLDIVSLEKDFHVIPAHYLLKITRNEPYLRLNEIDDSWLKAFLAEKPTAVSHYTLENAESPDAARIVLTGDTSELQSFVLRHLNTAGAWKESFELRRMPYGEDLKIQTAKR